MNFKGDRFLAQGIFYDGPTPPSGIFDNFTKISSTSGDLKPLSYLDMVLSFDLDDFADLRWGHFKANYSVSLLTSFYSISSHLIGVSHFSETLLKAAEDELNVRTFFSYPQTRLNSSLFHSTGPPN